MMVAAGTLQPQAEEHLGRVGRDLVQLVVAICQYQLMAGASCHSPAAATMPRTNSSYGRLRAIMSLIQLWKA